MFTAILRSLYVATLAIFVGSVVFFSLLVLPTLFVNLGTSEAGRIAALLFPAYYKAGLVCAMLLLVIVLSLAVTAAPEFRRAWVVTAFTVAVMLAAQAYGALVIHPQVASLRGIASARADFDHLHRLAVRFNGVVLVGGMGLVFASGYLLNKR